MYGLVLDDIFSSSLPPWFSPYCLRRSAVLCRDENTRDYYVILWQKSKSYLLSAFCLLQMYVLEKNL